MIYTIQEIAEYRAEWLETHPDEVIDIDTVVSCLNDEREAIIEKLIDDDKQSEMKSSGLFVYILRHGWNGYENLTHTKLWNELNDRGLEL
jgi:hypothetical protein